MLCVMCVYACDMCAYVCMFNYTLTINVLEGIRQTQDACTLTDEDDFNHLLTCIVFTQE